MGEDIASADGAEEAEPLAWHLAEEFFADRAEHRTWESALRVVAKSDPKSLSLSPLSQLLSCRRTALSTYLAMTALVAALVHGGPIVGRLAPVHLHHQLLRRAYSRTSGRARDSHLRARAVLP